MRVSRFVCDACGKTIDSLRRYEVRLAGRELVVSGPVHDTARPTGPFRTHAGDQAMGPEGWMDACCLGCLRKIVLALLRMMDMDDRPKTTSMLLKLLKRKDSSVNLTVTDSGAFSCWEE